ncbi:MAG TPA: hypothetical protein VFQ42_22560 [Mycobacterium sp.]|nr:hypothetical protein [Mycobacterium sp.]
MTGLRPFWRYYGAKWRIAPRYPKPRHRTIVEPFAGAAGYSLRYPDHEVILVEKYHVIAEIWRWLIAATPDEVLAIPCVDAVADLPAWVPQGARWLVGFAMNAATTSPRRNLSVGCRRLRAAGRKFYGWTSELRDRVASQVLAIKHWRVVEADYSTAPDIEATWLADPPYQVAGRSYVHGSAAIDYPALARCCRSRLGQTIVCESAGADWMPFVPFGSVRGMSGAPSREAIWWSDSARSQELLPLEVNL